MTWRIVVSRNWRLTALAAVPVLPVLLPVLIALCTLWVRAVPSPQGEEEDSTRRIWGKVFWEARDPAAPKRPGVKRRKEPIGDSQPSGAKRLDAVVDGDLIGVTIWRFRDAMGSDGQGQLKAERAKADTPFKEGERLRMSVEVPRTTDNYLYVIDREVYADGTTSDPYLIFPSQSTPLNGNLVRAGKMVYVPAQDDPLDYFTLQRGRKDQVREALTIIISPTPLKLSLGAPGSPTKLDPVQVAQWENQWGGSVDQREERGGAGKEWTVAEKRARDGERRLVQGDPLPQTIYRLKVKPGAPMALQVPLRIAQ